MPIPVRGDIAILAADLHVSDDARLYLLVLSLQEGYGEYVATVTPLATWVCCPIAMPAADLAVIRHVKLPEQPGYDPLDLLPPELQDLMSAEPTEPNRQAFQRVCDASGRGTDRRLNWIFEDFESHRRNVNEALAYVARVPETAAAPDNDHRSTLKDFLSKIWKL